jgi:hypothetical protein
MSGPICGGSGMNANHRAPFPFVPKSSALVAGFSPSTNDSWDRRRTTGMIE